MQKLKLNILGKIGEIWEVWAGNRFLAFIPKALFIKGRNGKTGPHNFFLNCSVKVHVKRIKRKATEWLQIGKVWDPYGDETVQYLNSGGEYTNPHMW